MKGVQRFLGGMIMERVDIDEIQYGFMSRELRPGLP